MIKWKAETKVFVNQEGYLPGTEKYFILNENRKNFQIINTKTNETVYEGILKLWKEDDTATGETLYIGEFSDFKEPGNYYISIEENLKSYNFDIDNKVFNSVRNKSLKSFYYQRSGIDLKKEHAGIFSREAGHTKNLEYHPECSLSGSEDVTGGWYDAGDYGRYIIPASVSLGVMLLGYQQYPQKYDFYDLNIPESGNGISDFLNEMKYELDWMLKMQHREEDQFKGALPYMLNSLGIDPGLPKDVKGGQFIYEFSSVATADFCAIMAMSARLFKGVNSDYADKCLNAALLAWEYLGKNGEYPEGGFNRPNDTSTGGYAEKPLDNKKDSDGRLWASLELYLTTKEQKFHDYFKREKHSLSDSWSMAWTDVSGFAKIQYVLGDNKLLDSELQSDYRRSFLTYCNKVVKDISNDGFKTVLEIKDYFWGSNGEVLNRAELLIFAYQLTDDIKYYNGALAQLNYVLGLNINNISYVTDTGSKSPKYIHHSIHFATGFKYTIPGLIAGGPNNGIDGDTTLPQYFDKTTPSAKCYIDHKDSYASNENCILYNAPLVPVSAYFAN